MLIIVYKIQKSHQSYKLTLMAFLYLLYYNKHYK